MTEQQVIVRPATEPDAAGIAEVLSDLAKAGKRKKRSDAHFVLEHYVAHVDRLQCFVAEDGGGAILGFQSLRYAQADNVYGAPKGWGIIGTHIRPTAARQGVGSRLFTATRTAAKEAGVPAIEALIGTSNFEGLAYYEAMGFYDYRALDGAIGKRFDVSAKP